MILFSVIYSRSCHEHFIRLIKGFQNTEKWRRKTKKKIFNFFNIAVTGLKFISLYSPILFSRCQICNLFWHSTSTCENINVYTVYSDWLDNYTLFSNYSSATNAGGNLKNYHAHLFQPFPRVLDNWFAGVLFLLSVCQYIP